MKKEKKISKPLHFYILVRSRNGFQYFDRCINSILKQKNSNFTIIFIDDNSKLSDQQKKHISEKLKKHIVIFNNKRKYSLRNAYEAIHQHAKKINSIVVSLDGDDWLVGDTVLSTLEKVYINRQCVATYGECLLFQNGNISQKKASEILKHTNTPYPQTVILNKSFRKHPFLPLHLRTWCTDAFKKIPKKSFLDSDGNWFKFCEDLAIFFPLLERHPKKVISIKKPLSVYNMDNDENDSKINLFPQLHDELFLRNKQIFNSPKRKINLNTVTIKYSRLLSLPFLSSLLYTFQFIFLSSLKVVFISKKNTYFRKKLFSKLNRLKKLNIQTHKLGRQTSFLKSKIYADISIDINTIKKTEVVDFVWTLVFVHSLSSKTTTLLKKMKCKSQ